ncbi:MAG: bifunctional phosphoribosylaminoimidazolecarboxamide formyltransferase/IMP cyclohydrolase [Sphingobacteriales bacterium]|jgi:phosphoribosylaminoimidazolecarboxamide formyltransferase/IMP cyclohydrolase|nr:bifunctional phosphoribosylaminoimidazolecarboxamide formyltransferase/IMP cyclohydrolase [Sphingobacteriales bacterium]MBP9142756.1 bifunctional phosphoribosylaminoimidazolecarboxamide formyltransferase/IMP cyclohydrolase [Chitinophagales bacterium]MDA0199674.1 bifunctional phosphoribosylaminoimidazolecarboxamide formyltransferase/IMP cyclohydrolase [Bacteroidota bacterium]MBK6888620.1 bifunctional phosphoribosylaminoimidazolecarboxamide formyltransferase/IMP cyclohydrolase [Sphingobacterial
MAAHLLQIKRALLSVSDKTNLIPLAQTLYRQGCEIISTGGTGKTLQAANIPYTDISQITGNPEAFGGRMKTISFAIGSALLFDRHRDAAEAAQLNITPIDLVVCNLYPFEKQHQAGADFDILIENIDIGGPTMVRAAAKNFKYVAVLTKPSDYQAIILELQENNGALSYQTRFNLMRSAFNHTADYDSAIATVFDAQANQPSLRLAFDEAKPLRYGENSHQPATFFRMRNAISSLADMKILHGKEISYNNLLDIQAAITAIRFLPTQLPACSVVKHNNPCGLAQAATPPQALELAWQGDPVSAFGGIIGFNCTVNLATAQFFALDHPNRSQRKFIEVVVAPNFTPEAIQYLQQHKDLRLVAYPHINQIATTPDYRFVEGGLLQQTPDTQFFTELKIVTNLQNSTNNANDYQLIQFGINAVTHLKSNAIAIVRRTSTGLQLLGMGAGQPNRLVATKLALDKCRQNLIYELTVSSEKTTNDSTAFVDAQLNDTVLVSDAFFPFPDNVELAASHHIKTIVQPGGSIRDQAVIEKCNELGITMLFSGIRHFKH